ncbi:NAD(P)H-binding protein [Nocardia bovistercoris]|uniref:NAD(P)H-binding protein n=1 Tax=Nocardia bovistercoris TaxID=2785916 RepID=A0A931IDE2_9NOCA|nr:NAD(P)H-binding protein [Nocardia bovistercoris]MBH0778082.1 NAD(P)H-binding protein [Nocardia bovistercoris]
MIVITTPTGAIGGQLLDIMLREAPARGQRLRVVVRDDARLPEATRGRVDVVTGSHRDPEVVDRAFDGAEAVFWVIPPDPSARDLEQAYSGFTEAAAKAFAAHGIRHVVGVSALGRGTPVADRAGLVTASLAMDDLIASTGVAYRALVNPSFMDNLLRQVISIRDHGEFTGTAAADHAAPITATADIAAAGARLLLDRSWTGSGEVAVLGPEDLSHDDMARIMSEALGRPIRYRRESQAELRAALAGRGASEAFTRGFVDMMRAKDEGLDNAALRTPATTSPTDFRGWCERVLTPAVLA